MPRCCDQVRLAAAVARELTAMHQESAAGEAFGDELEFDRGAAKTVDQQKAGAAFANLEAAINDRHGIAHAFETRVMS
jgi:hypothetical protein